MDCCVQYNSMRGGKSMEMDDLLDLLADARVRSNVVGLVRKPREEQKKILTNLLSYTPEDSTELLSHSVPEGNGMKTDAVDMDVDV